MTDIVYIVSHGFASRMVMQTDLLRKLRGRGLSVGVIASNASDRTLKAYCGQHGIGLWEFKGDTDFWTENHVFKRKYYLENMRANPALWEKHVHAMRYNTSRNPVRWLRPFYYGLIHRLVPHFPSIRTRFLATEQKRLHCQKARALLEQIAPRRLVSAYPVNFGEAVLLHNARSLPATERWIHLLSWDNITCKGRFPESADRYLAWGPIMRDELMEHYAVPEERIHMVGVPHFDLHVRVRQEPMTGTYLAKIGLDPGKPYLLFAMSSPRFAPCEMAIVEWLANKVSEGAFGSMQLVIRPHPQNMQGNLSDKAWLPRIKKLVDLAGVGVSYPELVDDGLRWSMAENDMVVLANLITGSRVVLNSGSTVTVDALFHDKPVLLTAFDAALELPYWQSARRLIDYAHLAKIVKLGGGTVVRSFKELQEQLQKYITNPSLDSGIRREALRKECWDVQGHATNHSVDVLAEFNRHGDSLPFKSYFPKLVQA